MSVRQAAALVAAAALTWPLAAPAQEHGGDAGRAAMMEAYEKAGTPGEPHARLDRMVGDWELEVRFWIDPEGEPSVSHGTSSNRWVMDGRFVEERVTGDFMGAPFRGLGFTGYNNVTEEYEATWMDNHSTQIYRYRGWMDDDGRLVLVSEVKDPVTGKTIENRSVSEFVSDDEMVVKGYEDRGEGEALTMELRYTRRK